MLLAGWVGSHLGALIPPPGGLEWESQSSSVSCSPLSRRKYSRVVNIWGFVVKVGIFFLLLKKWHLARGRKRRKNRSSASALRWLKEKMYLVSATSLHPSTTLLCMSPIFLASELTPVGRHRTQLARAGVRNDRGTE